MSVRVNGEANTNPAWKDWQPIIATDFFAASNLLIGDSRYQQVGKTVKFKFTLSTQTDSSGYPLPGSGILRFSLPVKAKLDTFGYASPIGQVTMALTTVFNTDAITSFSKGSFTGVTVLQTTNGYTAGGIPTTASVGIVQILRNTTYNSVSYVTRTNFVASIMPNSTGNIGLGDTWTVTGTYEAA